MVTFEDILREIEAPELNFVRGHWLNLFHIRERPDYHPEDNAAIHTEIVTKRLEPLGDPNLVFAGFFHDLGKFEKNKPRPVKVLNNEVWPSAPGHAEWAGELIRSKRVIQKLIEKYGGDYELVASICENHMRIHEYEKMRPKKQKDMQDLDAFPYLMVFRKADDMLTEFTQKTLHE